MNMRASRRSSSFMFKDEEEENYDLSYKELEQYININLPHKVEGGNWGCCDNLGRLDFMPESCRCSRK
jgi:hypothetical protein